MQHGLQNYNAITKSIKSLSTVDLLFVQVESKLWLIVTFNLSSLLKSNIYCIKKSIISKHKT